MKIICVGTDHKSTNIELREKLAFQQNNLQKHLEELKHLTNCNQLVILSTCNRVEVYAADENISYEQTSQKITNYLTDRFNCNSSNQSNISSISLFNYYQSDAIQHLIKVASGMESMVIGETEIFGQIKNAYKTSHQLGFTQKYFNILFQKIFSISKYIRTHTGISQGKISIGSVVAQLAKKIFGELNNKTISIIGTGKISQETLNSLISQGAVKINLITRFKEKSDALAQLYNYNSLNIDTFFNENKQSALNTSNIIISATNARHFTISTNNLSNNQHLLNNKSVFLIDLGVPRDIDPITAKLENIHLFNIDSLCNIANTSIKNRTKCISKCQNIIDKKLPELLSLNNDISAKNNFQKIKLSA